MLGVFVFGLFMVVAIMRAASKNKQKPKTVTRKRKTVTLPNRSQGPIRINPTHREAPMSSSQATQTPPPSRGNDGTFSDDWHGASKTITISGLTIRGGLLYAGKARRGVSVPLGYIDVGLPVGSSPIKDRKAVPSLPYWPNYSALMQDQRRVYLEWLASGRQDADIEIGYVFIFFYGLERRFCSSATEEDLKGIEAELHRLRRLHSSNSSFDGYSRLLLEAITLRRLYTSDELLMSYRPVPQISYEYPLDLSVVLASHIAKGKRIDADLAIAVLAILAGKGIEGVPWYTARIPEEFAVVLCDVLKETSPEGILIAPTKARLSLQYRKAAGGFVNLLGDAKLPSPEACNWTPLVKAATLVDLRLAEYGSAIGGHPDRRGSLLAYAVAPDCLKPSLRIRGLDELETRCGPTGEFTFAELFRLTVSETAAIRFSIVHHRLAARALAVASYWLEPPPEDGSIPLNDGSSVYVVKGLPGSNQYFRLAVLANGFLEHLATGLADNDSAAVEAWRTNLLKPFGLDEAQTNRFYAHLAFVKSRKIKMTMKKLLQPFEGQSPDLPKLLLDALIRTMPSTLTTEKPIIAGYEKICRGLAIDVKEIYGLLHHAAAAPQRPTTEKGPVVVQPSVDGGEKSFAIPKPIPGSTASDPAFVLDLNRLAQIKRETVKVSQALGEIFVDEEAQLSSPVETPLASEADPRFPGLAPDLLPLLRQFVKKTEWRREDYDKVVRAAGQMPEGTLDRLNEWGYEQLGDRVIDDGDPMLINLDLFLV